MDEVTCDVLVVGGSLGGVAAALRASLMGAEVVLLAESGWIGGQLTSQGVSTPDENPWLAQDLMGGTASYLYFRELVRDHYRSQFPLSAKGQQADPFCPGDCTVNNGTISLEPRVGMQILRDLLAQSNVTIVGGTRAVGAEMQGYSVAAIIAQSGGVGKRFRAPFVLDATDLGDLLPLTGAEGADWVVGAESRADTGEPDAPDAADPRAVQPFTFPLALERRPIGERHTVPRPADYDSLKSQQHYQITDGDIHTVFRGDNSWWAYRRIIAAANFQPAAFPNDLAQINTDANDFKGGVIPTGDPAADQETLARGRQASLGYLYWVQTECPRDENAAKHGYPELLPRGDLFSTPDGLAPDPYIRESRRLRALGRVVEQDVVVRDGGGRLHQGGPRAALYADSCGIGWYPLDVHGGPQLQTRPFQIPLAALVPRRITNLLAACKNLGVTHLTNGCYRVHPVEWNVGESAGALAAFCVQKGVLPRQVVEDKNTQRAFQTILLGAGIPLFWWPDLSNDHPAFAAAHLLALDAIFTGDDTLNFRPDDGLADDERQVLEQSVAQWSGQAFSLPPNPMTHGEAAIWLAQALGVTASA